MERTIPVIYILSNGRSGSTLLDLLLGAHPEIWTLGEAQNLQWELRKGALCGCGLPLSQCKFWNRVLPNLALKTDHVSINHFRERDGGGKVLRYFLLPDLWRGAVNKKRRELISEYGLLNARYFKTVHQAAEEWSGTSIRWMVDASKDPYRLLWLQSSGLFDLRVIHLMKDPRAFVYSMTKPNFQKAWRKVIRMSGRWLVENLLFFRLCRSAFSTNQVFFLRYEDLASTPNDVMARLCTWLGVDFYQPIVRNFRKVENHAISGNKMRWQSSKIRLDTAWRESFPQRYADLVWILTYPLAAHCGYTRKPFR